MSATIENLSAFHEVPYSNIEGAYVEVKQEVTHAIHTTDSLGHKKETKIREGTIVGRAKGTGLSYDSEMGETLPTNDCAIFISTPEDTVLEVRTDKSENELRKFKAEHKA